MIIPYLGSRFLRSRSDFARREMPRSPHRKEAEPMKICIDRPVVTKPKHCPWLSFSGATLGHTSGSKQPDGPSRRLCRRVPPAEKPRRPNGRSPETGDLQLAPHANVDLTVGDAA